MKKFKFSLIPTVISIGIILAIISVIAYYFIYQDSVVVTAVNNSKTALENGQLQTAISDLSNVDTRTYADNELVQAQEVSIQNFKNISNQYNEAINDMNTSNYAECIGILKSLHTNNTYLTQRISNALSIANTGYAQLLYKNGIEALQAGNSQGASTCYTTLSNKYPNSPFTKQLEAYLNGTAKGTLHSLNIEISRPTISPIGANPTPLSAPQIVQVVTPTQSGIGASTVANTTPILENSNSKTQSIAPQNKDTNNNTTCNTQPISNSIVNSNNKSTKSAQTPDNSTNTPNRIFPNQTSGSSSNDTHTLSNSGAKTTNDNVSHIQNTSNTTMTIPDKDIQKN